MAWWLYLLDHEPAPKSKPECAELLFLGATLETRPLQHLFVLLLTHALTALLNQRSHGAETIAASCDLRFQNQRIAVGFFSWTPVDPGDVFSKSE